MAKGITRKERINYEEIFTPIVMLKSIRVLLSIAPLFNYKIWQIDVKTAFLNVNLEEDIYTMQQDSFTAKKNQ